MEKQSIAICMPVFNEADGIREFVEEIASTFSPYNFQIFIIDDQSTDDTEKVLFALQREFPIFHNKNEQNMGHGPSTIRSLQTALNSEADFILAVDGDGQFAAIEMLDLMEKTIEQASDVGLGIRVRHNEPTYRVLTSWSTRLLVASKSKSKTADANTPLRVYRRAILVELLGNLKEDNPVPNLYITALINRWNLNVTKVRVQFRSRRGITTESTSWGKSKLNLPSKRFMRFCLTSFFYWLKN
jgi:glycosyltransferase involved in cell wall biosynthesis